MYTDRNDYVIYIYITGRDYAGESTLYGRVDVLFLIDIKFPNFP